MAVAFAVAGAGLAAAIWLPTRNDVAAAAEQPTAFVDEFSGAPGSPIDRGKWSLSRLGLGTALDGEGHLVVSRLLVSKVAFGQAYGHAEARIDVGRATPAWRAFAVLDPSGRLLSGESETLGTGATPDDGFHTYRIDWSPESVVWSVDGRPVRRLSPDVASRPLFVVLNLGTLGIFRSRMVVDYVRVTSGVAPSRAVGPTSAEPTPTRSAASTTAVAPKTAKPKPAKAPAWKPYTDYSVGDLVSFQGATYRVKEAHTSLPGWEPTALPELFAKV